MHRRRLKTSKILLFLFIIGGTFALPFLISSLSAHESDLLIPLSRNEASFEIYKPQSIHENTISSKDILSHRDMYFEKKVHKLLAEELDSEKSDDSIEVLFEIDSESDFNHIKQLVESSGGIVTGEFSVGDIISANVSKVAFETIIDDNAIDAAWPNKKYTVLLDSAVPAMNIPFILNSGYTGNGVTIAILDTGIDANHSMLNGSVSDELSSITDMMSLESYISLAQNGQIRPSKVSNILAQVKSTNFALYESFVPILENSDFGTQIKNLANAYFEAENIINLADDAKIFQIEKIMDLTRIFEG